MASISHYNIVQYYRSFREEGNLFIVMEYAEGGDLFAALQTRLVVQSLPSSSSSSLPLTPFQEDELWSIAIQLSQGLEYLHSRRILHRDIKPQNIFLDAEFNVKIGDLGLARRVGTRSMATTNVGTPLYFSPELCRNDAYDAKSDIWALGCVLYELACGDPPFLADNPVALASLIANEVPAPLPSCLSIEFRSLVFAMLQKSPQSRPSIHQILATPAVVVRIDKALLFEQTQDLCSRLARAESELFAAHQRIAELEEQQATAARSSPPPPSTPQTPESNTRRRAAPKTPRVHRELISPSPGARRNRTRIPPRSPPTIPPPSSVSISFSSLPPSTPAGPLVVPPPAGVGKEKGKENERNERLIFVATPSKSPLGSSPLSSLSTLVCGSLFGGSSMEGVDLVSLFSWERWSAASAPGAEGERRGVLTSSGALGTTKNVESGAVWRGRAKHSLVHPVSHPMFVFAPHWSGAPSDEEVCPVSVKHLRIRPPGSPHFEKLVLRPELEQTSRLGTSGFWLLNLTAAVPVKEFILEFETNNALDALLVLKQSKHLLPQGLGAAS